MKFVDLLKRVFRCEKVRHRNLGDQMSQWETLCISGFWLLVLDLAMETNVKANLCVQNLENALKAYLSLKGASFQRDQGAQYHGDIYRQAIRKYRISIHQSMNSTGGRFMIPHAAKECGHEWRGTAIWSWRYRTDGRRNVKGAHLALFHQLLV